MRNDDDLLIPDSLPRLRQGRELGTALAALAQLKHRVPRVVVHVLREVRPVSEALPLKPHSITHIYHIV